MIKLKFILALSIVLFYSCSQDAQETKINTTETVGSEITTQEPEAVNYTAPALLSDGKLFYDAKDFLQAKEKFQLLLDKYPDMPQAIEATRYLSTIDEELLWNNASSIDDISYSTDYILRYPKGRYILKAKSRNASLKILNMQNAYNGAMQVNSSSAWKNFLADYPNHKEAVKIKKRVIRLEVDEITRQEGTGEIPTFDQYGSGYSSSSVVKIKNDTQCELTVRYSGPDAAILVIPVGQSKSAHLPSGDYRIAASACGYNYAGSENLHGSYGSTFYITTTRY